MDFKQRKLIQNKGEKITFFQVGGLILIAIGVVSLVVFILSKDINNLSSRISIVFFITMLGVAFTFPDMLKDQTKEISTMRIVVFMFANIICMLLLRTGWDQKSLGDIGLDGYWMGAIAFLFGAKATQKYFENAKNISGNSLFNTLSGKLTNSEIAKLAVVQNRDNLITKHSNIESLKDNLNKSGDPVVTIYLKDNKVKAIPEELIVTLPDSSQILIQTEIITGLGKATPQIGQAADDVRDSESDSTGSFCCMVDSTTNTDFKGIVTSGHLFTKGSFYDYGGVLGQNQRREVMISGNPKANLFFQQMKFNQDIAILKITDKSNLLKDYTSFENGYYTVTDSDKNSDSPNVTIVSKGSNTRDAHILDFNVSFEINYSNSPIYMRKIILIGTTNDRTTSESVSSKGDSGSCVYHKATKKLIGILVGGNNKFSFVLPIQDTLENFNFKLL